MNMVVLNVMWYFLVGISIQMANKVETTPTLQCDSHGRMGHNRTLIRWSNRSLK